MVDTETARDLLRLMLRIRIYEDEMEERFSEGEIPGFVHLSHGHEGTHAGVGLAVEDDDWLSLCYPRLHGIYIAAGVPMRDITAELYGKKTGSNKGKGGSMHLADRERHLYGTAGTIGSDHNPSAGIALAQQMLETGNVVVDVFGDGGTGRGSLHEALNFASMWDLPVVYVIDNNRRAISFETPKRVKMDPLAKVADTFDIPRTVVDGTDPENVLEAVSEGVERARNGGGPTVVESQVYRLKGHYIGDRQTYRTEEELEAVQEKHDPVKNYREKLLSEEVLTEGDLETMTGEIEEEVADAVEFARESELPDPSDAYEDVYSLPLYGQEGSR